MSQFISQNQGICVSVLVLVLHHIKEVNSFTGCKNEDYQLGGEGPLVTRQETGR